MNKTSALLQHGHYLVHVIHWWYLESSQLLPPPCQQGIVKW